MIRPLVVLTLIFCLGIIAAAKIKIEPLVIYFLALIFLVLTISAFKKSLSFDILLACLVFLLGAGALKNCQILARCHISKYAYYKNNQFYAVKGFIVSDPVFKINKTTFIFRAEEIGFADFKHKACGETLTYIRGIKDLGYGDALIISGSLYRPFKGSYKNYLANQGLYSIMNVSMPACVIKLNYRKGFFMKRFALCLKKNMEGIIFKYLSPVAAGILDAMILGEKRNIPPLIYNSMIKSGTVHILVVSGFNVGIVFLIITLFLKLLRLPRKVRICLAIPLLILYCLTTGASNPVVRSTVMAIIFLVSYFFKREPDIYNSLSLAALFILSINPRQLFDVGFQLSFTSVISIVYLYPVIKSVFKLDNLRMKFIRLAAEGCCVSFSAWLGTLGLIAYYFRIFSPVTVLANIFIVPLATLITLCGFALMAFGLVCPYLAPLFALPCELLASLLINLNTLLIKIPAASLTLS